MAIDTSAVLKVKPFAQHHQLVKKIPPAEFRFIEFGIDIVMIEQEFLAEEQLEKATDQKNQIRRVAGMDDIETRA